MFGIDDAVAGVSKLVDDIVTRIWPDATEVEKVKLQQISDEMKESFQLQLAQIDINKTEAASASLFVAGWRPAVGWICVAALGYVAIFDPIARFIATVAFAYTGAFPLINTDITMQILLALLGLGGMRSFEKFHGVHDK